MRTQWSRRHFIAVVVAGVAGASGIALLMRVRSVDPVALRARADAIGLAHGIYIGYDEPETFFVAPWTSRDAVIPNHVMTRVRLDNVPVALDDRRLTDADIDGIYSDASAATLRFADRTAVVLRADICDTNTGMRV
jgi:hypothetical protein